MFDRLAHRRAVLRTTAALFAPLGLAGCSGLPNGSSESRSPSGIDRLNAVPSSAGSVLYADVTALLDDDVLQARIHELPDDPDTDSGVGTANLARTLEQIETEYALDPSAVSDLLRFTLSSPERSQAVIFWSDWTEDDVERAVLNQSQSPSIDEYEDRRIFETDAATFGVLGNGRYVVGSRTALKATIDVETGDTDPVDGRVRQGFNAAPDGSIKTAFEIVPPTTADMDHDAVVRPGPLGAMTYGYGTYREDGSDRIATVTVEMEDTEVAGQFAEGLRGWLSRKRADPGSLGLGSALWEVRERLLDSVTIEAVGSAVEIRIGRGADALTLWLATEFYSVLFGYVGQRMPTPPAVALRFEYDDALGALTITHTGGDAVLRDELYVRGRGFANVSGADMNAPGRWAGAASARLQDEPAVVFQDSVTVGVESDYNIRVVWEDDDGIRTSLFELDRGPDA